MDTLATTIQVTLNGDLREIKGAGTVTDLLLDLGLHPQLVVVEHNRVILDRKNYVTTEVRDGDTLELVHFVGGG